MSLKVNSFYTAGAGLLRFLIGITTAPLLIRMLGIREFGILSVLISVVAVTALIELDISSAVVTHLAGELARLDASAANETLSTSFLSTTALGLIGGLVLFASAWVAVPRLFGDPVSRTEGLLAFQILAVSVVVRLWKNWLTAVEAGMQRYDAQTLVEFPAVLLIQAGSVAVAALRPRAIWVIGWQSLVIAGSCIAHVLVLRKISPSGIAMTWKFSTTRAVRQFRFGLSQWGGDIGSSLFNNADRLIVNRLLGPAATGIYSAAIAVVTKILEIPQLFVKILPPAVSAAHSIGDTLRLRYLLVRALRVNCSTTFAVSAGVLFWADLIARFMLGPHKTEEAVILIRVMALIYSFYSVSVPACSFAGGLGYPLLEAKWLLSGAAVMCPLMYLLTHFYGLRGTALANGGFLVCGGIAIEVAHITGLEFRDLMRELLPFTGFIGMVALFTLGGPYHHLTNWARAMAFVLTVPAGSLIIAGKDVARDVVDMCAPGLRGIRSLVFAR